MTAEIKAAALPIRYGAEVTMPAGMYFLGDPCYAIDEDGVWDEWLAEAEEAGTPEANDVMVADVDGVPMLGFHTAYGDGGYLSSDGEHLFGVDSGMIGLVPIELVHRYFRRPVADLNGLGTFIASADPIVCTRMGGTSLSGAPRSRPPPTRARRRAAPGGGARASSGEPDKEGGRIGKREPQEGRER